MFEIGKKALVTTDNWFYAPNGKQYNAVFGTIKSIETTEQALGIKPNSRSANWFLGIGNAFIAGCQIHYCILCDTVTTKATAERWSASTETGIKIYEAPLAIYFAD